MAYWHNINPAGAIADFRTVFQQAGRYRWRFAILAGLTTFGLFSVMNQESWKKPRPKAEITYITSWRADRSDAEIIATNIANQKRKEARAAEQAKREEEVRNIYKKIGRLSGMDVEAIERKAAADQAASTAAVAKSRTEAMTAQKVPVAQN